MTDMRDGDRAVVENAGAGIKKQNLKSTQLRN